jgi:hypothetical protein
MGDDIGVPCIRPASVQLENDAAGPTDALVSTSWLVNSLKSMVSRCATPVLRFTRDCGEGNRFRGMASIRRHRPRYNLIEHSDSSFEVLEPRAMLAGIVYEVGSFETWNAQPQVIESTDPAGIGYYAPAKTLLLADSEIDENVEFEGHNVFKIGRDGKSVTDKFWPGNNPEPTGITWNEVDGFFYVTNDDEKTVTRFDENLDVAIGSIDARRLGVNDPEDITSDHSGLLYMVSGHPPLVSVFDSHFNFIRSFPTSDRMQDAEGIAFNGQNDHVYLVSAVDQAIFEYTTGGAFVEEYPLDGLEPPAQTPQGLTFAPCTDDPKLNCLYIADGGRDNGADGHVYELRLGISAQPYYTMGFDAESYSFGPIPENAIRGRVVGTVAASEKSGKKPSYSIIGGNVDGKFSIDSATGLITLLNTLDYETKSSYKLVIKAEFPGTDLWKPGLPSRTLSQRFKLPPRRVFRFNTACHRHRNTPRPRIQKSVVTS